MEIEIKKFKKIENALIKLSALNIFIGTNNAGKSSFIQGIQFAISACQTLELESCPWKRTGLRTRSLDSDDFLYAPTMNVASLYYGKKLTGARERQDRSEIEFNFKHGSKSAKITVSKGKNGGFTTSLQGRSLGENLSDMNDPYCVYVPGLAGIPPKEKYEVPISVRKSATRGDSNNYLRNILYSINKNSGKWNSFLQSVKAIYDDSDLNISVKFNENKSEYISVNVKIHGIDVPLDAVGTGLLQVIQIFAYIEYFNPKLILLDEPDAHIHPTKQKKLASELASKTKDNPELKIIFSTHSRYILEALEDKANVVHFKEGNTYSQVKGSSILLDIGAIDAENLFNKKSIKYIIATEDKVDNIEEKKEFLKKFLIANNLKEDEFVLHSYNGCTKVHFANILQGFVVKHIPNAKVILHIDRDQKTDNDHEIIKLKTDCVREKIALFVTRFQEIESYFCQPSHISLSCGIELSEAEEEYRKLINELEQKTRDKLSNFILRDRPELSLNKDKNQDIKQISTQVSEWMKDHQEIFTPGKELLGKVKNYIQSKGINSNRILSISDGLACDHFKKIISDLEEKTSLSDLETESAPTISH